MKPKEYAAIYKASPNKATLQTTLIAMLDELVNNIKRNHIRTISGIDQQLDLQCGKWREFIRTTGDRTLQPDDFMRFFQQKMPQLAQDICLYRIKKEYKT